MYCKQKLKGETQMTPKQKEALHQVVDDLFDMEKLAISLSLSDNEDGAKLLQRLTIVRSEVNDVLKDG